VQLAIDILAETPAALRLAANFLLDHALQREEAERGAAAPPPPMPPDLAAHIVPPPPAPPPPVDNVLPFVPPAPPPPVDTATVPAGSTVTPNSAPAAVPPAPPAQPPVADEYDASGVPWDARIHQKGKSVKKDKTWKLQKGIDQKIVEAVMRELAPRIRSTGSSAASTPSTVGASAPVTLPGAPAHPGATGAPAYPPGAGAAVPPPPPPPGNLAPIPPPPPTSGVQAPEAQAPITTPGAEGPGVDPFRALVTKITKARAAGKITPEEVTQSVISAGCPSLQLLNNMAHLIPTVDATIDAILAMR